MKEAKERDENVKETYRDDEKVGQDYWKADDKVERKRRIRGIRERGGGGSLRSRAESAFQ